MENMPSAWIRVTPWRSSCSSFDDSSSGWRVITSNFSALLPPFRIPSLMRELR